MLQVYAVVSDCAIQQVCKLTLITRKIFGSNSIHRIHQLYYFLRCKSHYSIKLSIAEGRSYPNGPPSYLVIFMHITGQYLNI